MGDAHLVLLYVIIYHQLSEVLDITERAIPCIARCARDTQDKSITVGTTGRGYSA